MIEHQNGSIPADDGRDQTDIRRGAEILRLILAYEEAIQKGKSRNEAAHWLARANSKFSPEFFQALVSLDLYAEEQELKTCRIEEISPGMVIQQDIRTRDNMLVLSKGQEVTSTVISRLKNLEARGDISSDVTVSVATQKISRAKGASS